MFHVEGKQTETESAVRIIVSRSLPLRSTAHPRGPAAAGSLVPVAPFTVGLKAERGLIRVIRSSRERRQAQKSAANTDS